MMVAEVSETRVQAAEREAVRREHQGLRRHRLEAVERLEVQTERIDPGLFGPDADRKSTRLNSSHLVISYAVFCLKKKKKNRQHAASYVPCRAQPRRS